MSKLRKAAKGRQCQIRITCVCNGDSETTVLAHYRMSGLCGTGTKPSDFVGAHACSACHDQVDGRSKPLYPKDKLRLWHLEGVVRTLSQLEKEGLVGAK
ncbi:MAG: DUF1364 domain-containing protein [Gammaproteobacteria bacterium]|nr:DUF1364 domain-containing protein [Gammaproteobacteria bacterium]